MALSKLSAQTIAANVSRIRKRLELTRRVLQKREKGESMRKMLAVLAIALVAVVVTVAQDRPKSNVKTSHIGPNDIAVTCRDGQKPQVKDLENGVVIVSCSK